MRPCAIDLGSVRVGLAVGDDLGLLAHPRPHLDGRDPGRLVEALVDLARTEGIDLFLVGLPLRLGGEEGPEARRARRFAAVLRKASGVRVRLVDERFTTREARSRLGVQRLGERRTRARIDSAAAAVLLQAWLDARGRLR